MKPPLIVGFFLSDDAAARMSDEEIARWREHIRGNPNPPFTPEARRETWRHQARREAWRHRMLMSEVGE